MRFFAKPRPAPLGKADYGVLAGGVALFVTICGLMIDRSSIWFDEAFGAYLIRFNFWDIARYTANDVHPPLYYWCLKVWSGFFGYTDAGLRSLSVLFGVIAMVFAFLIVRRYLGRRAAWLGLLFMSVTPFFIRYGIEARMYTMIAAEAFAGTYVLTLADRSKKTYQWVVYGLIVGLGMLTQYFILLVWLTHWLWRAIVYRSAGRKGRVFIREFFSRGWIVAHLIALVLFAPWIGPLYLQISDVQKNGFWIPPITPGTPVNFLTSVICYLQLGSVRPWLAVGFGLFITAMVAIAVWVSRRVLQGEQKNYYLLIAMLASVPPLLLMLLSLPPFRPSFVDRYVLPSALSVGLFVGVSIGLMYRVLGRRSWWVLTVLCSALFVYGITNVYYYGNYNFTLNQSNNTRQLIEAVRAQSPDDSIVADSPWLYYEAAFYSTPKSPVWFIDANTEYKYGSLLMLKENDLGKIKDLSAFEAGHPDFWYVSRPTGSETGLAGVNLKVIGQFRLNDSISNGPAYVAVHYKVL